MTQQTSARRLLVLHGPALEAEGVLGFFREHFDVRVAQDLDEALEAMRAEPFDAVLAETADFLPLERGVVTQQAGVVLDTLGDGVCLIGPRGELAWANRRLRELPECVLGPLRDQCAQVYEQLATGAQTGGERGRRFSLMPGQGRYYEVLCSPVRDRRGLLRQVVAVVADATAQRRQQMKLNAIDRAGRALVQLDSDSLPQPDTTRRLGLLEERIIRCSQEVLDYQDFAVLLLDEETNRLEIVASAGLSEVVQQYQLFASPENNGICGYVAATGQSYLCPDVRQDPRYLPGMAGARSSLTVPLRLHDKVIGVLNVESDRARAFGEEDRQFAEIFANHVALALYVLNLLACERDTAHTQASGTISAELAGALDGIITEAGELMEDYIGQDDLRRRLRSIIDRASEARRSIQQWGSGREG